MTDIVLAAVFLMNVALMALISLDVHKRSSSTKEESKESNHISENSNDIPAKKAGIGKSKFSVEDVKKFATHSSGESIDKCVGNDMEDVEFEESENTHNSATLDPEGIKKAFETDDRLADEIAESDDSVSQPLAGGDFFEELARTEVILGSKKEPTSEESQYVVKVFGTFRNTELMAKLPQSIKDKLNECHRKVADMMNDIPDEKDNSHTVVIKTFDEFTIRDIIPSSKNY